MRLAGEATYAASISALTTFTQILAKELGPFGITRNIVAPGPTQTDLIRSVPEEKIQSIVDSLAIQRLTTFEDIRNVVDFFVHEDSDYVTGQTIYPGGI